MLGRRRCWLPYCALVFLAALASAVHTGRPQHGSHWKGDVAEVAPPSNGTPAPTPSPGPESCRHGAFSWGARGIDALRNETLVIHVEQDCLILSNYFGYLMQFLLGALCVSVLLLKWHLEVPQRWFSVFTLDLSKQILGGLWYHVLNMVIAMDLANIGKNTPADECAWYFINFVVDTTLGLAINLALLKMSETAIGYDTGEYWREGVRDDAHWTQKLDWNKWAFQLTIYLGIVTLSKFAIVCTIVAFLEFWARLGVMGTTWIRDVYMRLFFVMVVVPAFMDTAFFVITDECIKGEGGDAAQAQEIKAQRKLSKVPR